jgi:hypothetical protein
VGLLRVHWRVMRDRPCQQVTPWANSRRHRPPRLQGARDGAVCLSFVCRCYARNAMNHRRRKLNDNMLSGPIPSGISQLKQLKTLCAPQLSFRPYSDNGHNGKLCGSLVVARNLHKNKLTSNVPSELGTLDELEELYALACERLCFIFALGLLRVSQRRRTGRYGETAFSRLFRKRWRRCARCAGSESLIRVTNSAIGSCKQQG